MDQALRAHLPVILFYCDTQADDLPGLAARGVRHFLRLPATDAELHAQLLAATGAPLREPRDKTRDALTGFAQASELRNWLSHAMGEGATALLLINLARFDTINAALGREAGDAALRAMARRVEPLVTELSGCGRMIARMPGAEFAVGLSGAVGKERLHLLAEAIVETVSRPLPTREGPIRLGCRVAVIDQIATDRTPNQFIRRASRELGEIRDGEAGAIRLALGEVAEAGELSRSLHADLRAALTNDEIDVLFQPQVSVTSGQIEGVEALARWRHPVRGEIGAATLFAVAEQSGYMVELSSHIQRRALQMVAAWPEKLSHLRLSVNVTGADLERPRFFKAMQAMIEESGFPRGRLTIEITESSLMQNLEATAKTLSQFRAVGCRVAIDDFGTGYSSLAWLKTLPADYLKLDQGLAGDIMGSERDAVVLRGVIGMARSLGLSVIAEGVETETQLALLAREGCTLYQGFFCSPPVDVVGLLGLLG